MSASGTSPRTARYMCVRRPAAATLRALKICFLLSSAVSAVRPRAPKVSFKAVCTAAQAGAQLENAEGVLDVASQSMVVGATCSTAEPCWATAGTELLGVQADDGARLSSVRSSHLLKRCSKPLSNHNHPQLIRAGLLDALWRLDPDSYFYAHVQEGKLRALPLELSVDPALRIPAGAGAVTAGWLPNGVTRGDLVLVWRRSGLRLLVVHSRRTRGAARHTPTRQGRCPRGTPETRVCGVWLRTQRRYAP
jgi:hypothetical protein